MVGPGAHLAGLVIRGAARLAMVPVTAPWRISRYVARTATATRGRGERRATPATPATRQRRTQQDQVRRASGNAALAFMAKERRARGDVPRVTPKPRDNGTPNPHN